MIQSLSIPLLPCLPRSPVRTSFNKRNQHLKVRILHLKCQGLIWK